MNISVVIPVFNECENVDLLYGGLVDVLRKTDYTFEIVFVDDGSSDSTPHVLEGIAVKDPVVRVVRLRRNSGQTVALAAGVEFARGQIIITLDGDLQNDPRDIPEFIAQIERGNDLVAGWRRERNDPYLSRKFPSLLANWLISRFLGVKIHDMGCGLKAYRADLIGQLPLYSDMHRLLPALCTMSTSRIMEVEVRHHPRVHGESKYGLSRIWRVLADVLSMKMLLSCASRPMHWFGIWALAVFLSAGVSAAFVAIAISQHGTAIGYVLPGTTALLAYLSLCLLFAGVFAEIVVRSGTQQRASVLVDVCEQDGISKIEFKG